MLPTLPHLDLRGSELHGDYHLDWVDVATVIYNLASVARKNRLDAGSGGVALLQTTVSVLAKRDSEDGSHH